MSMVSRNVSKGKGRRPSSDNATVPYYGDHDTYRDGGRDRELFRPGWTVFVRASELAGTRRQLINDHRSDT